MVQLVVYSPSRQAARDSISSIAQNQAEWWSQCQESRGWRIRGLRSSLTTWQVDGQPGLHETLSQNKTNQSNDGKETLFYLSSEDQWFRTQENGNEGADPACILQPAFSSEASQWMPESPRLPRVPSKLSIRTTEEQSTLMGPSTLQVCLFGPQE